MSNSLVPDQSRRFVGHDLDPKCLKEYQVLSFSDPVQDLIILLTDALAVHWS